MSNYNLQFANNGRLGLMVPLRKENGEIGNVNGKVAMIAPEALKEKGKSIRTSFGNSEYNKKTFDYYVSEKKACFSNFPFETWRELDRMIRGQDTKFYNAEYQYLSSLGLVRGGLMWGTHEIKNILIRETALRRNGKRAYNSMDVMNLDDPIQGKFGDKVTKVPVTHNTLTIGTRITDDTVDRAVINEALKQTLTQVNQNLLDGVGGDNGVLYQGLIGSDQTTAPIDAGLEGSVASPGVLFNDFEGVQAIIKYGRKKLQDNDKHSRIALMVGKSLYNELDTRTHPETSGLTIRQVILDMVDIQSIEKSTKLADEDMLMIPINSDYVQVRDMGGANIIELDNNRLATNLIVVYPQTLLLPGDGISGNITIAHFTGLLTAV